MSYKSREERARASRGAQQANSQRPGGADVDPRQRRASEAELQTAQRIGPGQEVDNGGRQNVRTDQTIRIDRRNRHQVNADKLRFETPVEGTQAANKDYVDTALGGLVIIGDSEYVVEYNRPPTGPSISTTTSWKPAPPDELYAHNNIVSPSNPAAVYAKTTHPGIGDECVYLYPGYVYGIALSLRCYQSAFELGLLFSPTSGATAWNVASRSIRFTQDGDTSTVYLLLDNTDGTYTYVTPAFRRYTTGTAIVSTVRMHARRLHPHYEGGYPALPLPGPPDAPDAGFEAESATLLAFRDELFSNLSTGIVTSVAWDFGDRYTPGVALHGSTERNPVYRYEAGGTFPVSITATGDGGSDTHTANVTVQDVVCTENLLASVGILDASDFNIQANIASNAVSPIAAPDGTLTAIRTTKDAATSSAGTVMLRAYKTIPVALGTFNAGSDWTWTFYYYGPSMTTNALNTQMQLRNGGTTENIGALLNNTGGINLFTSSTQGSESYTAEKNVDVSPVGNSGWYRVAMRITGYGGNHNHIQLSWSTQGGATAFVFDTWAPELRYGDWVARGKNKADSSLTNLLAYPSGSQAPSVSTHIAPDGTSTAVDLWASSGGYYPLLTLMPSSEYVTGGRYTAEFYIKHPLPSRADAVNYGVRLELVVSAGTSDMIRPIISRSGGITFVSSGYPTAGPGYTLDDTESLQITDDGWWRYRVSVQHFDAANPITAARFYWLLYDDTDEPVTIWNPRLTVGNPADYETVLPFVSGPQNLFGDGSDHDPATSPWYATTAGTVVTTNTHVAPNGRLEADSVTVTSGASPADGLGYNSILGSVLTSKAVRFRFYLKKDAAYLSPTCQSRITLADNPYTGITEELVVTFDMGATPAVVGLFGSTTGGPGYTADDVTLTEVSNDWVMVELRVFDYAGTAQRVYLQHRGSQGSSRGAAYDLIYWGSEITTIDPLDPV